MAKLIIKIHALSSRKTPKAEADENQEDPSKTESGLAKEESKEKFISNIKFQFKQASNQDMSMEEEDKGKEPLQNFRKMLHSN